MFTMKRCWIGFVFLTFAALPAVVPAQTSAPARKAVVVELFTSEGCSSCPPADVLLGRLRQEKVAEGVEVVPLGLHVDYWNRQGWIDRFSSSAYTERQIKYSEKLHVDEPYTPQMVVDGTLQFTGNDPRRAQQAILQAAQRPQLARIQITPDEPGKLQVQVNSAAGTSGDVMLAITEDNLSTKVQAGENGGRELHHSAVVRQLRSLGRLRDGSFAASVSLKFQKDWKRDDLRVVVFVQNPSTENIEGAATFQLAANSNSTVAGTAAK